MKNLLYLYFIALLGLGSCASQKNMETKPPFVIDHPTSQKWIGGKEERSSGIDVVLPITQIMDENVSFQHLYFRGHVTTVKKEIIDGKQFVSAKITIKKFTKPDIIMHADPRQEVGNRPPHMKKDTITEYPYELDDDEAVLSYIGNDGKKVKYTKISEIKEKEPLLYSTKPRN
ncbi:hypothetical protein H0I25_01685 [Cellulophaga sp. HaHa_2_95]|uniref:hypothetical protein n=1 Tax=Cellulophaga sp. HaHa_2_95 TaxID=2745558 RepID=UPI001C4EE56E|nr:hypothetical protein [Cellulophaga sp. HaHa_2_95]QXP56530.1 hypothetical protein H0I25_01685 [Cellulophaga sp. HaHa_2_95]